jgi:hypothetical protein
MLVWAQCSTHSAALCFNTAAPAPVPDTACLELCRCLLQTHAFSPNMYCLYFTSSALLYQRYITLLAQHIAVTDTWCLALPLLPLPPLLCAALPALLDAARAACCRCQPSSPLVPCPWLRQEPAAAAANPNTAAAAAAGYSCS